MICIVCGHAAGRHARTLARAAYGFWTQQACNECACVRLELEGCKDGD